MKTLSHTGTSLWRALLNWSAELTSRAGISIKPDYRADQIAADIAAGGNPSGV